MSIATAVDVLDEYLRAGPPPASPQRVSHPALDGELLVMPAWGRGLAGVKLVTVNPSNRGKPKSLIAGVYVLFNSDLEPVLSIDGAALTEIRTAAVSGVATRYLAREDSRSLVVVGPGVQGRAHVEAMKAVRDIDEVTFVSRDQIAGESIAGADIICTCTTSEVPLIEGSRIPKGVHINAVGAHHPSRRELDDETVRRSLIVVETRGAALAEAGDLLIPIDNGVITEVDLVAELHEVVNGQRVRTAPDDVTLFKSVGVAFEDLAVAAGVLARLTGGEL